MSQDPLRHWPVGGRGANIETKNTYIGTIFVPNHNPPSLRVMPDRQVLLLLGDKVKAEKKEDPVNKIVSGICDIKRKKLEHAKRPNIKQSYRPKDPLNKTKPKMKKSKSKTKKSKSKKRRR